MPTIETALKIAGADIGFELGQAGGTVDVMQFVDRKDLVEKIEAYGEKYDHIIISGHGNRNNIYLEGGEAWIRNSGGWASHDDVQKLFSDEVAAKLQFHHCFSNTNTTSWDRLVQQLRKSYDLGPASRQEIRDYGNNKW